MISRTAVAAFIPLLAVTAWSEEIVINNSGSGAGSLRQAIVDADPGETITFAPALSGATIILGGTQLLLNKNLTIDATALAAGITISGGSDGDNVLEAGESRIFEIPTGNTVVLRGLDLINGIVDPTSNTLGLGGAILVASADLTLERCSISGCRARFGGGIFSELTTLAMTACTVSDNFAFGAGGIYAEGDTTITQSTITGNTASFEGGGTQIDGTTSVIQSTITGNSAPDGGGCKVNASLTLTRCIVAGNPTGGNISGSFTDGGNNLTTGDPLLIPLGDYGGRTLTMPPLPGSPAIDAGGSTAEPADQRGFIRTVGMAADIGSVESQPIPGFVPLVTTSGGGFDGLGNGVTLREAITFSPDASTITFDSALAGGTIGLGGSHLTLHQDVTIDGTGLSGGITISGGSDGDATLEPGESRIFDILAGTIVTLRGLRLVDGIADPSDNDDVGNGGGIRNAGALTIEQCTVSACRANKGGGFYHAFGDTLVLIRCTFSDNVAAEGGGGSNFGELSASTSTFSGNGGFGSVGAGIWNGFGGTATLTQCTIAGNEGNLGSGIGNSGDLTLTLCTVSGNSASNVGGGIHNFETLTLIRSIVAGNPTGGEITGPGSLIDGGNNLTAGDPLLAALGDFGGPTQTMSPLRGSPAIDAGGPADSGFAEDQRGLPRVSRGVIDIGAAEYQVTFPQIFAPGTVAGRNGSATIRGSSTNAVRVDYQVAGQRGIKRASGTTARWIAQVRKLKRPLTRVTVTATSVDNLKAAKVVKVRLAKPKRRR